MGGALLRCIGIVRARARIGLRNLGVNPGDKLVHGNGLIA